MRSPATAHPPLQRLGVLITLLVLIAVLKAPAATDDYQTQPRVPSDMRIIAQAASDFYAEKKYNEASRCYQKMIEKYPRMLYAWSNLGIVYFKANQMDDAEYCFRVALKLSPKDVFSLHMLGRTLTNQERYTEAVDTLRTASQLAPKDTSIAAHLALALSYLNRLDEMRTVLKQAQATDPNNTEIRQMLESVQ